MALIPKDLCIDWPRTDPQSIHPWESESQPHSHLNVYRTFVCKSHFARAAKIRQKAGRPSRCQGETCIAVRSAPPVPLSESIFPKQCEEQYEAGGASQGVIFAEMCNLVRELATVPWWKPWGRRLHQSSLFATFADQPSGASVHMLAMHLAPLHRAHCHFHELSR